MGLFGCYPKTHIKWDLVEHALKGMGQCLRLYEALGQVLRFSRRWRKNRVLAQT